MAEDAEITAVVEDFARAQDSIKRADALIELAQDAGENVGQLRGKLAQVKTKSQNWQRALAKKGYIK